MKALTRFPACPRLLLFLFLVGLLAPAGTVWAADGPEAGSTLNYFGKFFHTDTVIGTTLVWLMLLCSTALLALIIQAIIENRRSVYVPQDLADQLIVLIKEKKFREAMDLSATHRSPLAQVLSHAMKQAHRGYDAMEEAVFEMAENIGNERIRKLVWMEAAGAAGPMLGLFGTVYGMIVAFTKLVALGGTPKPAELAGGIATALVCTFWGLVVGIPGVISAAFFRVRVESLTARTIWAANEVIAVFRPKSGASATPAGPARSATPAGHKAADAADVVAEPA